MKKLIPVFLLLAACGGNLSDEQRKKIRDGLEQNKIIQVSDAEIMSASLDRAHKIMEGLSAGKFSDKTIDSLETEYKASIHFVTPGATNARDIEKELIDAYILGMATGNIQENMQKMWRPDRKDYDSLLYSKPAVTRLADGSEQLEGVWNIVIARKDVVLEIGKSR